MSQKYCPECGAQVPENSKYCFHCGTKLPFMEGDSVTKSDTSSSTTDTPSTAAETTVAPIAASSPRRRKKKKKKKEYHIGYFIFLGLITALMLWLIHKKANLPEEKPMKSLPSERPKSNMDFHLVDSLQNDSVAPLDQDLSKLMPELPKINIKAPVIAHQEDVFVPDNDNDDDLDNISTYTPPSRPAPTPPVMMSTEQSVRNMLLSNRFVDPVSTDVITFTNNGNVLMKNGEALTSEMEVNQLSGNKAVLYFYDDDNNSWDVSLDVSGSHKKLVLMNQEYTSDN